MLADAQVSTRPPAKDLERARRFYAEKLGLEPVEERPEGFRYDCGAGSFALFQSASAASGTHTQMAWEVDDIEGTDCVDQRARAVWSTPLGGSMKMRRSEASAAVCRLQLGARTITMPLIVRCRRQNPDRRASESVPSRRRICRPSMNSGRPELVEGRRAEPGTRSASTQLPFAFEVSGPQEIAHAPRRPEPPLRWRLRASGELTLETAPAVRSRFRLSR
jgi:hypothetical protein